MTGLAVMQQAPRKLDRYEIMGELGVGGMATVYLGRLAGPGGFHRLVAIKRLHPHLQSEERFVRMFLDEARLAAHIRHPKVVAILEVGIAEAGYYIVMEYVEGTSLADLVVAHRARADGEIPVPIALRIAFDTLEGLHAAHETTDEQGVPMGLVHRDISPHNVMVGSDGTSRLTDFGVARAITRLGTTHTGQIKGKVAYMAPEQANGQSVDRRADVFALGVVVWELLAGRFLFRGDNDAQTLKNLLLSPVPRLGPVGSLPPAVDDVVMRALAREPEDRYSTCREFADALENAVRGVCPPAPPREVAEFVQRVAGARIESLRSLVRSWSQRGDLGPAADDATSGPAVRVSHAPHDPALSGSASVSATAFTPLHQAAGDVSQRASAGAPKAGTQVAPVVALSVAGFAVVAGTLFFALRGPPASSAPANGADAAPPTGAPETATRHVSARDPVLSAGGATAGSTSARPGVDAVGPGGRAGAVVPTAKRLPGHGTDGTRPPLPEAGPEPLPDGQVAEPAPDAGSTAPAAKPTPGQEEVQQDLVNPYRRSQ